MAELFTLVAATGTTSGGISKSKKRVVYPYDPVREAALTSFVDAIEPAKQTRTARPKAQKKQLEQPTKENTERKRFLPLSETGNLILLP